MRGGGPIPGPLSISMVLGARSRLRSYPVPSLGGQEETGSFFPPSANLRWKAWLDKKRGA